MRIAVCRKVDSFSFVELKENQKAKHPIYPFQISGTENFTVRKKYMYIWK